jgi:hypothetical protein
LSIIWQSSSSNNTRPNSYANGNSHYQGTHHQGSINGDAIDTETNKEAFIETPHIKEAKYVNGYG